MALTFFWRCEGTTLDGTHDYTAGDSTAAANGTVSISATAAKVGTNGVLNTDGADYYIFVPTDIFAIDEGSLGFWVKQTSTLVGAGLPLGVGAEEAAYGTTNNWIFPRTATGGEVAHSIRKTGGSLLTLTTTAANMLADAWYFITMSWHLSQDKRRIRVYDASGDLLDEQEDTSTDLSAGIPTTLDQMFVGQRASGTVVIYVDNVFIGSAYADADAFYTKRNITSYTEYAPAYVKVLVHSDAASDADVAGVVFEAPSGDDLTGAKIGEFSGQTFETELESGQAVLKVATTAFGGESLAVSDQVRVILNNGTDGTNILTGTVVSS